MNPDWNDDLHALRLVLINYDYNLDLDSRLYGLYLRKKFAVHNCPVTVYMSGRL